jgi:hypothetical protein
MVLVPVSTSTRFSPLTYGETMDHHILSPSIVACGYREILSVKTSLSFPAWLVRISTDQFHWRSKKDFLLLFRAAAANNNLVCPRSALNQLAKQAPWKLPTLSWDIISCKHLEKEDVAQRLMNTTVDKYQSFMRKKIKWLDTFLKLFASRCGNDETMNNAWEIFIRPRDTDSLLTIGQQEPSLPSNLAIQQSSRLGQYFCSPKAASKVVQLTLEFMRQITHDSIVILEPSCGHGDILSPLLSALESGESFMIDRVKVVACEIDDFVLNKCRGACIEWISGDFLQTSGPHHHNCTLGSETILAVGGPPYTSGAGSGDSIQRDLPQLFLWHCIEVWNASFVIFLLPMRYKAKPMKLPSGWVVESHELEDNSFLFQGHTEVTQPSVIQCFFKV